MRELAIQEMATIIRSSEYHILAVTQSSGKVIRSGCAFLDTDGCCYPIGKP